MTNQITALRNLPGAGVAPNNTGTAQVEQGDRADDRMPPLGSVPTLIVSLALLIGTAAVTFGWAVVITIGDDREQSIIGQ